MKVLLVASNRERYPWPVPPIGACYIASSLKAAGYDVGFLDLCWSDPIKRIPEKIADFGPDLVGVSIRNIDNVDLHDSKFYLERVLKDVIRPVRHSTDAPILIGGSGVSVMPELILDYLQADFALSGEGEDSLCQLLDCLECGRSISEVPGLCYRESEENTRNPELRAEDLDSLSWPKIYDWVDWKRYGRAYAPYPVQTKRGCALSCSYCVYNSIEGRSYRLRQPSQVVDEIEDIVEHCSPQIIEFTDSTFNIPLEHAVSICQELIERKLDVAFTTMGINPGAVTRQLVDLMAEAGFMEISCTPESGSNKILRNLGKNFDREELCNTAAYLRKAGIPVVWYFLFGAPGEDEETIQETFSFIEENICRRDLVFITSGIRIFPGSPLHQRAIEEGQIAQSDDILRPVWYKPEGIEHDRMKYLIDREVITHANYINLQDNTDNSILARVVKRMYAVFRIREPVWTNIMRRYILKKVFLLNRYELWKMDRNWKKEGRDGLHRR